MKARLFGSRVSLQSTLEFIRAPRRIQSMFIALVVYTVIMISQAYRSYANIPTPLAGLDQYIFLLAGATSGATYLIARGASGILSRTSPRLWISSYAIAIALCLVPFAIALEIINPIGINLITVARLGFLVAATETISAFLVAQAQRRTKDLEQYQGSLLLAEEAFRQQVVTHLHDQVQSRLVVLGIQLGQIATTLPKQSSDKIQSLLVDLESLRRDEVRDFSRKITPNIEAEGLEYSLNRLFLFYKQILTCRADGAWNLDQAEQIEVGLGIYRIVEQAIQNSVIHGKATNLWVSIGQYKRQTSITITNDGVPIDPSKTLQGHGFAVIDSWVQKFKGSWEILPQERQTTLRVLLPFQLGAIQTKPRT